MALSSEERARKSRLKAKRNRTAGEQSELADLIARTGKPGRKPHAWGPLPGAAPVETNVYTDEQPAATANPPPPPPADASAEAPPISSDTAPPIEVADLSGKEAGESAGPDPAAEAKAAERAAAIATYTALAMEVYSRTRANVAAGGGFALPDQLTPVVAECWRITLDKYLPPDVTDLTKVAPFVCVGATVYHAGYAWVLHNRAAKAAKAKAGAAPSTAGESASERRPPQASSPPPVAKKPPAAKPADDDPFAGMEFDETGDEPN